jgi:hypothetical protein
MSFGRSRRRPPTRREQIDSNNAWHRFYAASSDNPDAVAAVERDLIVTQKPKREVRRPVDGAVVRPTEYQEQSAVIDWWARVHKGYGLPAFALFSVPNGAYLASGYMGAGMLKRAGMRKGIPDLILDCARGSYHGLRIEMKRINATESDKSAEQKEVGEYLMSAGYKFLFASGADQAIAAIEEYMA